MRNILKSGDIIVVALVILFTVPIALLSASGDSDYAVIYVEGSEFGRYHLSGTEEKEIKVVSDYGYNIIKIANNEVCVADTSCKDKLEIYQGTISKSGQSLVCLPNRIVVTIEGGNKTDATAF